MSDILLREVSEGVATLTLNRPERRNALSLELMTALDTGLAEVDADPEVRAIVLCGAGEKAFCAGGDLGSAGGGEGILGMHRGRRRFADLLARFAAIGTPVVAAATGHALGGGFGLLMASDFAVICPGARYGTPEIKRGLFPMMIMSVMMRTLGRRRTLELILTGKEVDAETLDRWGVATAVVERDQVLPKAREIAAELAALSPAIMSLGRRAYYTVEDLHFAAQLEHLNSQLTLNTLTEDAAEGIRAFFEKRPPEWKGR